MYGLMEVESQDLEAPGFPFPSESGLGALLLPPVLSQSWLQGFKNDQTVSLCYGLTLGFTQTLNDILGSGRFCWYSCCWWYSAGVERTGVIGYWHSFRYDSSVAVRDRVDKVLYSWISLVP